MLIAAVGVTAAVLNLAPKSSAGPFKGQPMSTMFSDGALRVVEPLVAAPEARARRDAAAYLAQHPVRDDAAFTTFALSHVAPPPSAAVQTRELADVSTGIYVGTLVALYERAVSPVAYRQDARGATCPRPHRKPDARPPAVWSAVGFPMGATGQPAPSARRSA